MKQVKLLATLEKKGELESDKVRWAELSYQSPTSEKRGKAWVLVPEKLVGSRAPGFDVEFSYKVSLPG